MSHSNANTPTVRQLASAEAWLAATELLRGRSPLVMNVLGSVGESVVAGAQYDSEMWLVIDHDSEVVGCACRTAPWPMLLAPLSHAMSSALSSWLSLHAPDVTALTGPAEAVNDVAEGLGCTTSIRMSSILRVLDTLTGQPAPPGKCRRAVTDDLPLLVAWFTAFAEEAGLHPAANDHQLRAAIGDQRFWVWEVDQPVAMGGHARVVTTPGGTVGRIGPIYTDAAHRNRGYGSAITHAIATQLQPQCDQIMLFADATNAASNSIYERLGFRAVTEILEVDLVNPA